MSGDHNMHQKPEALELADALDAIHYHNADSLLSINVIKQAGSELSRLHEENEALRAAIRKLHAAKGRYHTQLACCDLFDMVGLPNERPKK